MNWKESLSHFFNVPLSQIKTKSLGGGCINDAYSVILGNKKIFVKTHHNPPENFFKREASGLKTLAQSSSIQIPSVLHVDSHYIALEWIETAPPTDSFFETFGINLATLHRQTQSCWGFHEDNFIGIIKQHNNLQGNFIDFFWLERLEPQIRACSLLSNRHLKDFSLLESSLKNLLNTPEEKPALIHGDLWSGNFLCSQEGNAVLIDPAVAYSHREMELAFTDLFGGFSPRFLGAYNEVFPLLPGYNDRKDLYNLYPLMVHVNLFGRSYLGQVESILKRFI